MLRTLLLLGLLFFVAACSSDKEEEVKIDNRSPQEIYAEAQGLMAEKRYKKASEAYQEIERLHPFSEYATRAGIMAAYAKYRDSDYDDAVILLERFLKLHPAHADASYAYYLRAICYYEQITDIRRDQQVTEQALAALKEVVLRFPESPYARDAKIKMDLTNDHLAGKQLEIGRYYQKRGEYVAAINRFRDVVERFQTTAQTPEALHRLVETYLALGVTAEAQKYAAVLGHNYPDNVWYKRTYKLMGGDTASAPKEEPKGSSRWLPNIL